jgi:subfamily B ATP-binding cassette protein MsbA
MAFASIRHFREIGMRPSIAAILLALQIAAIALEGIGLGLLLPVVEYIKVQGDPAALMEETTGWKFIARAADTIGITVTLELVMLGSFGAILFRQLFVYAANRYRIQVREDMTHRLRLRLFDQFMRSDYAVQQSVRTGEIVNELVIEAGKAVRSAVQAVRLTGSTLLLLAYAAGLFAMSVKMAFFAIGTLVLTSCALIPLMRYSRHRSVELVSANESMGVFITEWVRQSRLVRLCERFTLASDTMTERSSRQIDHTVALQVLAEKTTLYIVVLSVGAALLVLYLGITLLSVQIEILAIFVIALIRILPVAQEMLNDFQSLLSNIGSLNAIIRRIGFLKAGPVVETGSAVLPMIRDFDVCFEKVSFRYDGNDSDTLTDIDFTIPAGRIVALVGPSGAGKSTIVELLAKLRSPTSGRIRFGTTDLQDIPDTTAHRLVAYVPQHSGFIDLTVGDFIRFGNSGATQAEVEEVARTVGIADFIAALPKGYDTMLGENGQYLSGGQLQRMDLARAVLQKPSILVLDEPSSHLDPVLTRELERTLRRLARELGTSILIVSHGAGLTIGADEVIVLENGAIVERGTPDMLSGNAGWFEKAFLKN